MADHDGSAISGGGYASGFSSGAPHGGVVRSTGTLASGRRHGSPRRGTVPTQASPSVTTTYHYVAILTAGNALVRWTSTTLDTTGATYPSGGSGALVSGSVSVVRVA